MTTTMQRDSVWGPSVSEEDGGDRRLLRFVARHGCVCMQQVERELGVGRTAAYRRVAACIEAGLLERLALLREEPSLLRATRQGLRYVGLGGLRVAEVSPGAVDHWLRCTTTAQRLGERFGHERIRTERELVFAEQLHDGPLASAVMGRHPNGKPRLHRPDLVLLPPTSGSQGPSSWGTQGGCRAEPTSLPGRGSEVGRSPVTNSPTEREQRTGDGLLRERAARTEDTEMRSVPEGPIAVEVELTPKAPRRLEAILRAWRRADWVWQVHYYCAAGQTRRAVERAATKVGAGDKIFVAKALPR